MTDESKPAEQQKPPDLAPDAEALATVRDNKARDAAQNIAVSDGGVILQNWAQSVDYAKYMAASRHAIPKHLRDNVGACIAVTDIATRWGFAPYQVARLCYMINDQLAFESQLVHAVIEKFAPLKYRLRPKYEGEGDERTCTITGHFRGEVEPLTYTSPPVGKINPKNSPLWKSDVDQQLFYFSSHRWARRYAPDIILGVYSVDEMADSEVKHLGFDRAKDVTPPGDVSPKLMERLKHARSDSGFVGDASLQNIEASLKAATTVIVPAVKKEEVKDTEVVQPS